MLTSHEWWVFSLVDHKDSILDVLLHEEWVHDLEEGGQVTLSVSVRDQDCNSGSWYASPWTPMPSNLQFSKPTLKMNTNKIIYDILLDSTTSNFDEKKGSIDNYSRIHNEQGHANWVLCIPKVATKSSSTPTIVSHKTPLICTQSNMCSWIEGTYLPST